MLFFFRCWICINIFFFLFFFAVGCTLFFNGFLQKPKPAEATAILYLLYRVSHGFRLHQVSNLFKIWHHQRMNIAASCSYLDRVGTSLSVQQPARERKWMKRTRHKNKKNFLRKNNNNNDNNIKYKLHENHWLMSVLRPNICLSNRESIHTQFNV